MTAIPWGQKNKTSEIIQSHTVTPPFAAMDGTTLRLKTATTKSRTRSQRRSTRRKCGTLPCCRAGMLGVVTSCDNMFSVWAVRIRNRVRARSVAAGTDCSGAALVLGLSQPGRDFFEGGEVLVDVSFGVLHGNGPLLVPPIGLSENAAINHAEPILTPQISAEREPIAIVADFFVVEHQRPVGARAAHVRLQPSFGNDRAVA